ncbi:MAG TPA: TetR family transcriptional regulator [Methylibium sp.]
MARKTKEEAQATRHAILDAAEKLFQQHGVSRSSLQDIAAAAGVTRGAIYWHFRDKADLFNAMMERVTLPLEQSLEVLERADQDDPLADIRALTLQALLQIANDPQTRRVFEIATHKVEYVDEQLGIRDRHLHSRNGCLVHLEHCLATAKHSARIDSVASPRAIALGLHALIDGLIQNWLLDPAGFDLVAVGLQAVDTYLAGLKTRQRVPKRLAVQTL